MFSYEIVLFVWIVFKVVEFFDATVGKEGVFVFLIAC